MNDFTKTNLFYCPIYKIRIDPNSYDKEKIINDIKYNKSLKNTRNDSHQIIGNISDIHHSYNDHENVNFRTINYKKLIDEINSCKYIISSSLHGIIMGVKHKKYNIHGVQFHPESIKTPIGLKLLKNFINYKIK